MKDTTLSIRNIAAVLVLVAVGGTPMACGSSKPVETRFPDGQTPAGGFTLYVLRERWGDLLLHKYDFEEAWAVLSGADLSEPRVRLDADDVQSYDWPDQILTLTPEASIRLQDAFPQSGLGLEADASQTCFVVVLDGRRLYGGIFLERGSTLALAFPIIYVGGSGDRITLALRPSSLHESSYPFASFPADSRKVIEQEAIHDFFQDQGKLAE
jgi:hypothetical protein